ncbi:arf-GAP with Rho-GAP domain, ANK repeat and PH domain-containing protein 1 [Cuculus canorus]|uniref:arf-GAP with Rho-GAP domain, ANK repeat and PH domain-containing protein 1 n=1 Tax=Cuculus canorus TaxID=55661 RepID=UPI0023AB2731|nr:arf-GAP with Rho-GAP domain, ANK repeat and PH domain-containing protein 1 [Cuculus canorus]
MWPPPTLSLIPSLVATRWLLVAHGFSQPSNWWSTPTPSFLLPPRSPSPSVGVHPEVHPWVEEHLREVLQEVLRGHRRPLWGPDVLLTFWRCSERSTTTTTMEEEEKTMPVSSWLAALHLEQYVETFHHEDLWTVGDCRALSDEVLTHLGVLLPGHRRRILGGLQKTFSEASLETTKGSPRKPLPFKSHRFRPTSTEDLAEELPPTVEVDQEGSIARIPPPIPPRVGCRPPVRFSSSPTPFGSPPAPQNPLEMPPRTTKRSPPAPQNPLEMPPRVEKPLEETTKRSSSAPQNPLEMPPWTTKRSSSAPQNPLEMPPRVEKPLEETTKRSPPAPQNPLEMPPWTTKRSSSAPQNPLEMPPRVEKPLEETTKRSTSAPQNPLEMPPRVEKPLEETTKRSPPAPQNPPEMPPRVEKPLEETTKRSPSAPQNPLEMPPRVEKPLEETTKRSSSAPQNPLEMPPRTTKRSPCAPQNPLEMPPRVEKPLEETTKRSPCAPQNPLEMPPRVEKPLEETTKRSPPAPQNPLEMPPRVEKPLEETTKRSSSAPQNPLEMPPRVEKPLEETTKRSPSAPQNPLEMPPWVEKPLEATTKRPPLPAKRRHLEAKGPPLPQGPPQVPPRTMTLRSSSPNEEVVVHHRRSPPPRWPRGKAPSKVTAGFGDSDEEDITRRMELRGTIQEVVEKEEAEPPEGPPRSEGLTAEKGQRRRGRGGSREPRCRRCLRSRNGEGPPLSPTLRAGWLDKNPPQGSYIYQKRWVTLDADCLRYFDTEKDIYSKRFISISSISRVVTVGEQKFEVLTHHRNFVFRAESDAERNEWMGILQEVVEEKRRSKGPERTSVSTTTTTDVSEKKGFLELRGFKNKVLVVVEGDKVLLCKNVEDHRQGMGITSIAMKVGSVRQVERRSFDLITPSRVFSFVADSEQEKEEWMEAMKDSIAEALSNSEVAEKIWRVEGNRFCADCGSPKPEWASINLCVVICRRCAGEHRGLGPTISKVRSLKMDRKVWTEELIELFQQLGNAAANAFWAANVPPSEAIVPTSGSRDRRRFLSAKYRDGKYRRYHPLFGNQEELNRALCVAVTTGDLAETQALLFCGAAVTCATGDPQCPTPLTLAEKSGQRLQMEFLHHNRTSEPPRLEVGGGEEKTFQVSPSSVTHHGFLYKTPSMAKPIGERKGPEEFSRRWCSLGRGVLRYSESDRSAAPNGEIRTKDIVCLAKNPPRSHGPPGMPPDPFPCPTERPLHYSEKVLPIVHGLGTGSYLVVRKQLGMESMLVYLASRVGDCKHGMMKFREERNLLGLGLSTGFHDRYFILNNSCLRLYKEVRSHKPEKEWPVKNLKVYLGVKKKLRPPTCWGFTVFYETEKHEKQQWYLCCDTQSDLREWFATFLHVQHGGALWPSESSKVRPSRWQQNSRMGNVSLIPLRGNENEMRSSVGASATDPLSLLRNV